MGKIASPARIIITPEPRAPGFSEPHDARPNKSALIKPMAVQKSYFDANFWGAKAASVFCANQIAFCISVKLHIIRSDIWNLFVQLTLAEAFAGLCQRYKRRGVWGQYQLFHMGFYGLGVDIKKIYCRNCAPAIVLLWLHIAFISYLQEYMLPVRILWISISSSLAGSTM